MNLFIVSRTLTYFLDWKCSQDKLMFEKEEKDLLPTKTKSLEH